MTTSSAAQQTDLLRHMDMPPMDLSAEERLRQLMASRNEWKLYHRTCDSTGDNILSAYPADSPYTVYRNDVWWGDSWDALDYGRDFDFSRPFFEQFYELQLDVPREGTSIFQSENCDYNSHLRESKNCYLNSLVLRAEDMHYSYWMVDVETVLDSCYHISGKSSLCYECVDFGTCFNCVALQECFNCSDCAFSLELRNCKNCLFCSNLTNKEYHIRNQPCTEEEFNQLKSELFNGSYASWQAALAELDDVRANAIIHRSTHTLNCENVLGDHMLDSKNCQNCFDGNLNEDCTDSISLNDSKDIHSCHSAGWPRCERLYSCSVSRGCLDMAFCRYMWSCNDMRYCDSCQTCKHCFGCIGLRHKDYCILNKQYTKEEYEDLRTKIIEHMKSTGEWGSFWPYEHLPFAYNESAAQDYYPLDRSEALARGFRWRDVEDEKPDVKKVVPASQLPDQLSEVPDEILDWAIVCEATDKPFRIIKQELNFYRRMQLSLPRIHPMERHRRRITLRNPYELWKRTCTKCNQDTQSTYAPERPETVYCEECYVKEVY